VLSIEHRTEVCFDWKKKTGSVSRRKLIGGGIAMSVAGSHVSQVSASTSDDLPMSPDGVLERLIEGNLCYATNASINTDHSVGCGARTIGQQPFAAIVSCADSRVAPELIFDQGPGALFVVGVAGNFITQYGLASLEYGAAVLGHTYCGAVSVAISSIRENTLPEGHLPSIVNAIRPAVSDALADGRSNLMAAATA
jgi:carbonic anhydrase